MEEGLGNEEKHNFRVRVRVFLKLCSEWRMMVMIILWAKRGGYDFMNVLLFTQLHHHSPNPKSSPTLSSTKEMN